MRAFVTLNVESRAPGKLKKRKIDISREPEILQEINDEQEQEDLVQAEETLKKERNEHLAARNERDVLRNEVDGFRMAIPKLERISERLSEAFINCDDKLHKAITLFDREIAKLVAKAEKVEEGTQSACIPAECL